MLIYFVLKAGVINALADRNITVNRRVRRRPDILDWLRVIEIDLNTNDITGSVTGVKLYLVRPVRTFPEE